MWPLNWPALKLGIAMRGGKEQLLTTPFNKYDKEKKQDHLKPKANILLEPDVKLNDNIDNDSQPLNKTLDLYEFQENDLEEKASKSPEYDKLEEKTYTPLKAVNFDCYPILTKIDTNLNTDHRDYEDNEDFSESRDTSSYVPETEIESEGGEEETIIPIFKTINVTCPESTLTKDEPSEKPHISNIETNNSIVALSHRKNRVWDRKNFCPICFVEVSHFARHLERNHADESRVKKSLSFPKGSNEKKTLWDSLRKEGNFHLFREEKKVVAVGRPTEAQALDFDDFVACENCSGVYKKKFFYKHAKKCQDKHTGTKCGRLNALTQSQTFLAASRCQNSFLSQSRLKKEVFCIMKADKISATAKNDILICLFGETHLKKHKRKQIVTVTSNKMRQLARLLIALREFTPVQNLIDAMKPELFDDLVTATKVISGFSNADKSFKSSSLALHMGTTLKQVCDIINRMILKKSPLFTFKNPNEEKKSIRDLKTLLETSWANEISSLALKTMKEQQWEKPQILPVTSDVIKFNNFVKNQVEDSAKKLNKLLEKEGKQNDKNDLLPLYKTLAKGIALLLILNRKRIGEIQYLEISTYKRSFAEPSVQKEIAESLTVSEKLLCRNFRRIITGGKGSKPVAILISPFLNEKIELMIKIREKIKLIPEDNKYIFANPNSSKGWFHGTSVIKQFAKNCGAKDPNSLTSTKFRKQTATILQIMDINNTDMEQLAIFMGHTKKTNEEWYRLPQDLYQTAKIAKLMIALNKGDVNIYKGKSLDDINIEENDYLEIEDIETEVNEINEKELTEPTHSWSPKSNFSDVTDEKIEQANKNEKVSSKGKRKLFTDEMTHPMQNNKGKAVLIRRLQGTDGPKRTNKLCLNTLQDS
ncbi:uncharacterized protein LOC126888505 [Diabrotica virgifera virgifera]|uniref:Tyr recombinase domain-containing protein n=1 Tax=Diabrotica virgifera virgifera TaxID=50390 RepID=A0ABM5KRI4_DIAVI|nr:uncharacterized protein LOC126888505 [Diabrotica virgifera virgifera]